MKGLSPALPQQFELAGFQGAAGCTLAFAGNPGLAELNGRMPCNPALTPVTEHLPAEPGVVASHDVIGR